MNPRLKAFGVAFKENPALGIALIIVVLAILYYIYKKNNSANTTTNQGNTTSNPPIAEVYAFDVTPPGPTSASAPTTPTSGGGGQPTNPTPTGPTPNPIAPGPVFKPPVTVTHPIPAPVQNQPSRTVTVGAWPAWNSTLWGISEHYYGSGADYMKIYNANKGTIGNNPSLLHPGEVLTIP